ncbi:MAG: hypothetical protein FJ024_06925 [Chloroflexi bacterium]|nr:hypothetical protein [Chloroflexota bacterium]
MRRILGALFGFMLAVSLVLIPSPVSAGLGDDCTWDPEGKGIKWSNNENSWNIYLKHWGRTPIQAMSRLAGLVGPDIGVIPECPAPSANACLGGCAGCRSQQDGFLAGCSDPDACTASKSGEACAALGDEELACNAKPIYKDANCCCCWGISLAFAGKAWAGCDISTHPRVNNDHPAHRGNSAGGAGNYGGDWGSSGCPHTECITQTWCLQDNLCANPGIHK